MHSKTILFNPLILYQLTVQPRDSQFLKLTETLADGICVLFGVSLLFLSWLQVSSVNCSYTIIGAITFFVYFLQFPRKDSITIERVLEYYLEGQTLELICKFKCDSENKIEIKWILPNDDVEQNVSLFYNKTISWSLSDITANLIYFRIGASKLYHKNWKEIYSSVVWLFEIWMQRKIKVRLFVLFLEPNHLLRSILGFIVSDNIFHTSRRIFLIIIWNPYI